MPNLAPRTSHFAQFLKYWLPVLIWAWVIFHLSSIPYFRIVEGPWDFWIRKTGHMVVYAVLARLIARAFIGTTFWPWKQIFAVSLVASVLYACTDEYHQSFVPGRVGAVHDVALDGAGAWLGLGVVP